MAQDMNKEDYPPAPDDWEEDDEPERWEREDIWDDSDAPWVIEVDNRSRVLEEQAGLASDNPARKEDS